MEGLHIRNAGFEDAAAIFRLVCLHPKELVPRPVNDIVGNIDRFLIAEKDGKLVGTVSWQILPEIGLTEDPTVEIKSLAVADAYRRRGIGRALVEAIIDRIAPYHPAQIIALTFHPQFFQSFGFREVPKQRLMHKIYMGCVNCAKYDSPFTCPEVAMRLVLRRKSRKRDQRIRPSPSPHAVQSSRRSLSN
jgi:amino-acid N-acetyltransferase